jgi:hypothetical protein
MPRLRPFAALVLVVTLGVQAAAQAPRPPSAAQTAPLRSAAPVVLPGTPSSAFGTIQGSALSAASAGLPNRLMRLRDARFGRMLAVETTD